MSTSGCCTGGAGSIRAKISSARGEPFRSSTEIVRQHKLPKSSFEMSLIYAAMFLVDRRAPIEFGDEAAYKTSRWACYQARLVHALSRCAAERRRWSR